MPRGDNKFVCQSYFINKTLQQVNDYENNNRERQKPQIQQKSARRKCRSNSNQNLFSENFIYDPLNFFPKPIGILSSKMM